MRQVFVLGGLLGVALIGSYLTWTADETRELGADEVVVYNATPADVSTIAWKSEKLDVELRPGSDDHGDFVMVHVTERREKVEPPKNPKSPDGHDHGDEGDDHADEAEGEGEDDGGDEAAEEAPEIETVVTYFKGNEAATSLLESLAPLVAMRALPVTADADKATYGLDEPTATLEVNRSSGQLTLQVGGETFGAKDKYVGYDGKVFLVDDQTLRPLQYAKTRLLERNLQPLREADIEQVSVTVAGKTASFVQENRDDRAKAYWAASDATETEHAVAGTWVGKAFKMRAREYVEPADLPDLQPVFSYTVTGDGQTWTVDVRQSADEAKTWYAEADFLRSTVELTASLASDAAADVDSLFAPAGGE